MADEIFFSIIIYIDDDEALDRCLKSIGNIKRTKVIIVDPVCSELSSDICEKQKKKLGETLFRYIPVYGMGIGEAYNTAIPEITGRYVNFIKSSMRFGAGALEMIQELAEKLERPKLITLSPWTVNEKGETVQYRMSPKGIKNGYEQIVLNDSPEKLQLMFSAYFIRCYLINSRERHMWFRTDLGDEALLEMLLELVAEIRGYVSTSINLNYTVQLEDNTSAFLDQHEKWWYIDALRDWVLPFAKKWAAKDWPLRSYIRTALLYLVYARYNCNYNDRNKGVLDIDDVKELNRLAGEILNYVDNALLWRKGTLQGITIPRSIRLFFLKLKAESQGEICEILRYGDQLLFWTHDDENAEQLPFMRKTGYLLPANTEYNERIEDTNSKENNTGIVRSYFTVDREEGHIPKIKMAYRENELLPVCNLKQEHVILSIINYKEGKLEIDGMLSLGNFFTKEEIHLALFKDKLRIDADYSEVYGLKKLFGFTYSADYQFHVSVPVYIIGEKSELSFAIELDGVWQPLEIRISSIYVHLSMIKGQYWCFGKKWILAMSGKNKMVITPASKDTVSKKETAFRKELEARSKKGDQFAQKALDLRKEYFARKEEFKDKRIWITFDKLYKAGDNGEYLYHYISEQQDGIDVRYLIKNDSLDFERLKEEGNISAEIDDGEEKGIDSTVLEWGTDEALITAMYAEAVLTTHANIASYVGFDAGIIPYICDLFEPINVCIQHGLTVQKIAQFQNRLFDNLELYLCASPNEIRNLSKPIYGFYDKSLLKLTGVARYDGLHSKDMRQILITPTWRRNIANSNIAHFKKGHNDYFKNSDYFHIYNSLLNDEKLIATAKEYGYKIIYLLHPAASAQLEDFDQNDSVEIIPAAGDMNYEKILTESSLMVTDYSGVQFDFAYMRKPILYYHPKALPPHYDESDAYVYEKDAFGEIIDEHDRLVEALCEYMSNNCTIKEEYRQRADRFFAYNDFNNCKRIYDEILTFVNDRKTEEM